VTSCTAVARESSGLSVDYSHPQGSFGAILAHLDRWTSARLKIARLTLREYEVLRLLGQGFDNRRISKRLGVTERTARLHVSSILDKLELESRLQAGLVCAEHELRQDVKIAEAGGLPWGPQRSGAAAAQ
jgi:DNA-binding NarL/FixJ family response regulator